MFNLKRSGNELRSKTIENYKASPKMNSTSTIHLQDGLLVLYFDNHVLLLLI